MQWESHRAFRPWSPAWPKSDRTPGHAACYGLSPTVAARSALAGLLSARGSLATPSAPRPEPTHCRSPWKGQTPQARSIFAITWS